MPSSHHDAHPYGRSADDVRRRDQRVRRTRRLRATQLAFFSVLAIVLVGIGAYAVREFREPVAEPGVIAPKGDGSEPSELTCPEPGTLPLDPAEVTVTVLNGTGRSGLAGQTSDQLGERGYTVGDPGNTDRSSGPATIVYGPSGYVAAQSVLAQLPEATLSMDDRDDATVSLLLGKGFDGLAEESDAAAALEEPVAMPEGC
ncbi:LytR C-terminal domain-containing protein [Brachybacterium fresconis]|uniref:LytR/CpsA/Psr regulator C-terminal domain-containing protein n=1 Tax=Brachybacterium fresconis TaxID=173363 RepID=A0ABS4YLT7_9MICO|nr:LytR C-terminal domain-containing protein [Brachybacterium fresconis]MBP2408853.1 hypothetical protein [Brachybacterium fresconis]